MPLGNGGAGAGGVTNAGNFGGAAEPLKLDGRDVEGRGTGGGASFALGDGAVRIVLGATDSGGFVLAPLRGGGCGGGTFGAGAALALGAGADVALGGVAGSNAAGGSGLGSVGLEALGSAVGLETSGPDE
jgi:hypothetical protein